MFLAAALSAAVQSPLWARRRALPVSLSAAAHDDILMQNAADWVASPEIQALLRESSAMSFDDEESFDGGGGGENIMVDELANPGQTAPAHARPLAAPAEAAFVARALREEEFLGPGDEMAVCKEKRRRDESGGAARARHAAVAVEQGGVARVRGVLSAETAGRLRAYVVEELEALAGGGGEEEEEDCFRLVAVGSGTQRLSALVGEPSSGDAALEESRWDIRLSPEASPVRSAMRELLAASDAPLGRAFAAVAGADATLWECAAIVSAPGAAPQILHADATWTERPLLVTSFVALQDVTREMGPTRFVRGTHTDPAHAAALADGDATGLATASGTPPPSCVALLQTGDAALYDGRLLHCGGANRSDALRILFYLTLRAATDDGVGGAETLYDLCGRLLEDSASWR